MLSFALLVALTAPPAPVTAPMVTIHVPHHTELVKSAPSKGEVLKAAPKEIRLWFSAPIDTKLASIELQKADATPIAKLALQSAEEGKVVFGTVDAALAPGSFIVAWKTAAADGHVVKGKFLFSIEAAKS